MTTRNFHLTEKSFLSIKTTRIVTTAVGVLYLLMLIFASNWDEPNIFPKYLNLIFATFWIIYPQFMFNENSKFAPRIQISQDTIILKNDLWSRSKKIALTEIESVKLSSFGMFFTLQNSQYNFKYNSDADVSIQIKKTLMNIAQEKGFEITGG